MSGVWHKNDLTYFPLPKCVFEVGRCGRIKGSAFMLYGYACFLSQERSKATVFIRASELKDVLGMAKGTALAARAVLEEDGLMNFSRVSNGYMCHLLNPETGKPLRDSVKGDYAPLDFDALDQSQLKCYYKYHLKGLIKDTENGIMGICPFHDDSTPSLDINFKNGSVWYCHSCNLGGKLIEFETRVAKTEGDTISRTEAHKRIRKVLVSTGAIDGTLALPEAVYLYHSSDGEVLFEVLRFKEKKFAQRRPDPDKRGHYIWNVNGIHKVLYGVPAIEKATVVILLEGEKDCDNLRLLNLCDDNMSPVAVTTCSGGASKWQPSYSKSLRGKKVVIFPDSDFAGRRHAKGVQEALKGYAAEVRIVGFPAGFKDMTEYLGEHDVTDLARKIDGDWIQVPTPI
jgi:5S rRNA maturation endonuclease (ribonuclease M5)